MKEVKLKIGLEVLRSYRRLAYTPWYALAEFVDNSTQSYRDHKDELDRAHGAEKTHLTVSIDYNRDARRLVVADNAMGMSLPELESALQIGRPPPNTRGRSQYGLGLKTAACWFGDRWIVRTKKLGEKLGYSVTVDVAKVATGEEQALPTEEFTASESEHFTEITIEALHVTMQGRNLGKTKKALSSMYRADIKNLQLKVVWEKKELPWRDELEFLPLADGTLRKSINFEVGSRRVDGWVGVLAPGSSSRGNAGFALIRRGRLIRGSPEGWRPEAVFGLGRNDLVNQRLAGEMNLDEFDVTHTKDDILWQDDEEDEVQDGIKSRIDDVLKIAREYRHKKKAEAKVDRKLAMDSAVQDTDLAPRMIAAARAVEEIVESLGSVKAIETSFRALFRSVANTEPLLKTEVSASTQVTLTTTARLSQDAPYILAEETSHGSWVLVINASHPVCSTLDDVEALRVHVQHAVADWFVMWVSASGKARLHMHSTVALKDALLRLMSEGRN